MKRAQALKYISDRLSAGMNKAEVFEELRGQIASREDLLFYLAEVPDIGTRAKYRKINIVLFVLLVLMTVAKFLVGGVVLFNLRVEFIPWFVLIGWGLYLFSPFVLVFFAVLVFKFRFTAYRFLPHLGIAYLLLSLSDSTDISSWLIWQIPTLIAIFLAYYIGKRAFPYYGFSGKLNRESLENVLNQSQLRAGAE